MLQLPLLTWNVSRTIVSFGPFALRWYGLLLVLGFVLGYYMTQAYFKYAGRSIELLDSLLIHLVVGTLVGARLGHCLLYEPDEYFTKPLRILKVWEGGLASHGGFAGVMVAMAIFSRKHRHIPFLWLADRIAIPAAMTAGLIRLGNLFNSEILGKPTDGTWGVIFKRVDAVPRHPTQIYESLGYFSLSLILYLAYRLSDRRPREGSLLGFGLIVGFSLRAVLEFLKENQESFEDRMILNMGQTLSLPFIMVGIALVTGFGHKRAPRGLRRLSSTGVKA